MLERAVQLAPTTAQYRVTLSKDGKMDSADLEKEILEKFLAGEGGSKKLRKALGKAVSHLSINFGR